MHPFPGQTQCHDQIIFEPWDVVGSLLIRYNKEPCSGLFWYPFCQNSGWGDEEATVACRELGYSYGVSGETALHLVMMYAQHMCGIRW